MTRLHATLQLLAHGALTFAEFREITGWPPRDCENALRRLAEYEVIKRHGSPKKGVYALTCKPFNQPATA